MLPANLTVGDSRPQPVIRQHERKEDEPAHKDKRNIMARIYLPTPDSVATLAEDADSRPVTVEEFSQGHRNVDDPGVDLVVVLRGYFDDSSDAKRKRVAAVGGLVGHPLAWADFEKRWSIATYDLPGPFHAADCDSNPPRGVFAGWSKERANRLMKNLVGIILDSQVKCFASMVPIPDYRKVFPESGEYDPYILALKHTMINMARVGAQLAQSHLEADGIAIWHENGDTTPEAVRIFQSLKALSEWQDGRFLRVFAIGTKGLLPLQGADLIAREAFKLVDNIGKRPIRIPVQRIKMISSFHVWNKDCFEYLKANGGPSNLKVLTEWGYKEPPEIPSMTTYYQDSFDRR